MEWSPFIILLTLGIAILTLLFGWLVVAKAVTRVCRRCGVDLPCPYWLGWVLLIRPGRWLRERILDRAGLRRDEHALDLGCGVGVFTAEAARRIGPGGRLVAVDVQPQMIDMTARRLQRASHNGDGAATVETRLSDARRLPFDDRSFDRVLLISAFPELPDKPCVLAEIGRVLRTDGVLSITEEFFDPDMYFPHETRRIVEQHGFRLIDQHGAWWSAYTMNFRRAE